MVELEAVRHLTAAVLVGVGVFFLTVGTVGLLRFPNVYNRMHATSKPTTLGTAAVFFAGVVHFGPGGAGLTSLVGILFLFLTVPTGAHMISRAAQKTGVPFLGGVTWPSKDGENDRETLPEDEEQGREGEETDGSEADGENEASGE
ncbi:MAG: multicomponent Na+:H+ antiporter subunit G [Natronomonas sp.]|jgi:multicomponent Na+:H+ antiporter subunit G